MIGTVFLRSAAGVYGFLGAALFFSTLPFLSLYGIRLEQGGEFVAKFLGLALLAFAAIYWTTADNKISRTVWILCVVGAVFNLALIALIANAVVTNAVTGWLAALVSVLIHGYLFGYFTHFALVWAAPRVESTP